MFIVKLKTTSKLLWNTCSQNLQVLWKLKKYIESKQKMSTEKEMVSLMDNVLL